MSCINVELELTTQKALGHTNKATNRGTPFVYLLCILGLAEVKLNKI